MSHPSRRFPCDRGQSRVIALTPPAELEPERDHFDPAVAADRLASRVEEVRACARADELASAQRLLHELRDTMAVPLTQMQDHLQKPDRATALLTDVCQAAIDNAWEVRDDAAMLCEFTTEATDVLGLLHIMFDEITASAGAE